MAARLGLMPWDARRLQPAELKDLFDGWLWRRSRDMEVLGMAVAWLRCMMDSETTVDHIMDSFPGYDGGELRRALRESGWDPRA